MNLVWLNNASIPNFTFLSSLEVPHYYYPGGGGGWGLVGVEIIRIKAVLSSTGLELELSMAKWSLAKLVFSRK